MLKFIKLWVGLLAVLMLVWGARPWAVAWAQFEPTPRPTVEPRPTLPPTATPTDPPTATLPPTASPTVTPGSTASPTASGGGGGPANTPAPSQPTPEPNATNRPGVAGPTRTPTFTSLPQATFTPVIIVQTVVQTVEVMVTGQAVPVFITQIVEVQITATPGPTFTPTRTPTAEPGTVGTTTDWPWWLLVLLLALLIGLALLIWAWVSRREGAMPWGLPINGRPRASRQLENRPNRPDNR